MIEMGSEESSDVLLNNSWYLRKGAREYIEANPSVKRMAYSIVGRRRQGSPSTVNGYVQGIKAFVKYVKQENPEITLKAIQSGEIDPIKVINREGSGFIDTMLESYANRTVHTFLFGVKKWLEVNEVKLDWSGVEMPTTATTQEKDRAPTPEELVRILNHTTQLKDKLVVLILASSGLRIGTLLSLNWGDVSLDYPDVARLTVRRAPGRKFSNRGSRGGESQLFVTWITPEAKELLLQYRDYRIGRGEEVGPESPLIESDMSRGEHMTISGWHHRWYRILKRAGLDEKGGKYHELHIHTLRKFFRSRCVGVDPSYREHWMGHKGGYLDEAYFRAEESRHLGEYRKCIPHLSIFTTQPDEKKRRIDTMLDFLRMNGAPEEALVAFRERMDREKNTNLGYELIRSLNDKLYNLKPQDRFHIFSEVLERTSTIKEGLDVLKKLDASQPEPKSQNGFEYYKANSEDEMVSLLNMNKGWEIERELNGGGKFIMKRRV